MESSVASQPVADRGIASGLQTVDSPTARGASSRVRPRPSNRSNRMRAYVVTDLLMLSVFLSLIDLSRVTVGPEARLAWTIVFPILLLPILALRGLYKLPLRVELAEDASKIAGATAVAAMTTIGFGAVFVRGGGQPRDAIAPWLVTTAGLVIGRTLLQTWETRARQRGELLRPTLIVGAGNVGRLIAKRLAERPKFGLHPVGFVDDDPLITVREPHDLPILGDCCDVARIVSEHHIEQVVVSFSTARHDVLLEVVEQCESKGIPVSVVPRLFEKVTRRVRIDHLGAVPLVTIETADPRSWQVQLKYFADRALASILLIVALPVLIAAVAATWISVGRPILFKQSRVGRDGHVFSMLKFRSMRAADLLEATPLDLEPGNAPGGVEGSDRRTRVGTFLRRTSLDELPQLLNVVKGDMSIVGPRPERPEFVDHFGGSVYRYRARHRMKSGITGWAQVNGLRGKTSIVDRVEWDNYYIENWSVWFDLKIVLQTIRAVWASSSVE